MTIETITIDYIRNSRMFAESTLSDEGLLKHLDDTTINTLKLIAARECQPSEVGKAIAAIREAMATEKCKARKLLDETSGLAVAREQASSRVNFLQRHEEWLGAFTSSRDELLDFVAAGSLKNKLMPVG